MIARHYELVCDQCGCADYPPGDNIKEVLRSAKRVGWIIKTNGLHYDSKECEALHSSLTKKNEPK